MRRVLWLSMAAGCTYFPVPLTLNEVTCEAIWTASPGAIQGENILLFAPEEGSEATISVSGCEATWARDSSYGCTQSTPPCCDPDTEGRLICRVPAVPHSIITLPVQVELTTSTGLEAMEKTVTVLPTSESASLFVDSELGAAAAGTPSEPTTLTDALTRTANPTGTTGIYVRGSAAEISQPLELARIFLGGGLAEDWSISSCRCPGADAASWQGKLSVDWNPEDCLANRLLVTAASGFSGSSLLNIQLEHGAPPSGFQGLYLHNDKSYLSALVSITLVSDGSLGTVDLFVVDSDLHSASEPPVGLDVNDNGSGTLAVDLLLQGIGVYLADVASDATAVRLAAPLGESSIHETCFYVDSDQNAQGISWAGGGGGHLAVNNSSVAIDAGGEASGIYVGDPFSSLEVSDSRLFASGETGATGVESWATAELQGNELHVFNSSADRTSDTLTGIEVSAATTTLEANRFCAHGAASTVLQVSVSSTDQTTLSGNAFQVPACGTPAMEGETISQAVIHGGEVSVSKNLWCPPSQFQDAVALELADLGGMVEKNQISGPPCEQSSGSEGGNVHAMRFTDVTGLTVWGNWISQLPSTRNGSRSVFDMEGLVNLTVASNAIVAHNAVFATGELGTADFAFNTVLFTELSWWEENAIFSMIGLGSILGNVHHNVFIKPSQLDSDLSWPSTFTNNVLVVSSLAPDAHIGSAGENAGFASTEAFLCDARPWSFDPHLSVEFQALQGELGDNPPADIDSDPRSAGSHWGADANPASCGRPASPSSATD